MKLMFSKWFMVFAVACLAVVIGAMMITGEKANGGAVTGGATEWTQVANNVQLLFQVQEQYETYSAVYDDLLLAKRNIKSLAEDFLGDPASDILKLRRLINNDRRTLYRLADNIEDFEKVYPGYDEYLDKTSSKDAAEIYGNWDARTKENVKRALQTIGANEDAIDSEAKLIDRLHQQSRSADGQKAVIQAGNDIALAQIKQNQRLQALVETQINLQANYQQSLQDKEAKARADKEVLHYGARGKPRERLQDFTVRPEGAWGE